MLFFICFYIIYYFFGEQFLILFNPELINYKNELNYLILSLIPFSLSIPLQPLMLAQKQIQNVFKINFISLLLGTIPLFYLLDSNKLSDAIYIICYSIFIFGSMEIILFL